MMVQNVISANNKAYTLIEVLVAIIILSFVSIISFSFMTKAYESETKIVAKIKALQLAYSCSEYLQSLSYNSISVSSCDFLETSNIFRNINLNYSIDVQSSEIIENELKLINIIVKWNLYGQNHEYKLSMLVNNDV